MNRTAARRLLKEWQAIQHGIADQPEREWHREEKAWRDLISYLARHNLTDTELDPRSDAYLEA